MCKQYSQISIVGQRKMHIENYAKAEDSYCIIFVLWFDKGGQVLPSFIIFNLLLTVLLENYFPNKC